MSFFGDFGRKVVKARERQARAQVYAAMLHMDDKTLGDLGVTREQLKKHTRNSYQF